MKWLRFAGFALLAGSALAQAPGSGFSNTAAQQYTTRNDSAAATLARSEWSRTNTTAAPFTLTLPAAPVDGASVCVSDVTGTWDTNNLTVARGGSDTINGATTRVFSTENGFACFWYSAPATRWTVEAGIGGGLSTIAGASDMNPASADVTDTVCVLSLTPLTYGHCPVGAPGAHNTTHVPGGSDPIAEVPKLGQVAAADGEYPNNPTNNCNYYETDGDGAQEAGEHCINVTEVWSTEFLAADPTRFGVQGAIDSVCTSVADNAGAVRGGVVNVASHAVDWGTLDLSIPANCWVHIKGQGHDYHAGGPGSSAGTIWRVDMATDGGFLQIAAPNQQVKISDIAILHRNMPAGGQVINCPQNACDHALFDNLMIVPSGANATVGDGIQLTDAQGPRVTNSRIEGVLNPIHIDGTEGNGNIKILGNVLRPNTGGSTGNGILIDGTYPCSDVTIEGNALESGNIGLNASSGTKCVIKFANYTENGNGASPKQIQVALAAVLNVTGGMLNNTAGSLGFHRVSVSGADLVDTFSGVDLRGVIQMDAGKCVVTSWTALVPGVSGIAACDLGSTVVARMSAFDADANLETGATLFSDGSTRLYTNPCLQVTEAAGPYMDVAGSSAKWSMRFRGTPRQVVWADFFDAGPIRECIAWRPTSSAAGTGGTGGFSISNANRTGWPSLQTTIVAAGMNARTATGGGATTLSDTDGSTLASEGGKYVRITSGTGAGQTRYIASATATQLTVDLAWTTNPDATSVYDIFTHANKTGGSGGLTIVWEGDVYFDVNLSGATEDFAFDHRGSGWAAGRSGFTALEPAGGVVSLGEEFGAYEVLLRNAVTPTGWVNGRLPIADAATPYNSDTAAIALWLDGWLRFPNHQRVRITCSASGIASGTIGVRTHGTWGSPRIGGSNVGSCGVGIHAYGNNVSSYVHQYVAGNHINIAVGDATNGSGLPYYSSATSGYSSALGSGGLELEDGKSESGEYGLIVSYGGGVFKRTYMESSSVSGHQVLAFGGQCNATDPTTVGRPCGGNDGTTTPECGTGSCVESYNDLGQSVVFEGGNTPIVTSANTRWGAVTLGLGSTDNAKVQLQLHDMELGYTTKPVNNTLCDGLGNPYWFCRGADNSPAVTFPVMIAGSPTGIIDFGRSSLYFSGHVFWPYRYMTGLSEKVFTWSNNAGIAAAGDCLRHDRNGLLLAADCTVGNANEWAYPLHVDGGANHYNWFLKEVQCVHGSYDDGGEAAEAISIAARLGANASLINVGNAATMVEGTNNPGDPVTNYIGENSALAACSTGTCSTFTNPIVGLRITSVTDATVNNSNRVACTLRVQRSLGND